MNQNKFKKLFGHTFEKERKKIDSPEVAKHDIKKPLKPKHSSEIDVDHELSKIKNTSAVIRIQELEGIIRTKDLEIDQLKKELEKLRSAAKGPIHAENYRLLSSKDRNDIEYSTKEDTTDRFPKDNATSKKILEALNNNMYMRNLDKDQLAEVVVAMFLKSFLPGDIILKEGEIGDCLFLVEEGELELSNGGDTIGTIGPGKVFGEHSFLYNCTRTTNVKAITGGKLWVLCKPTFENIMIKTMLSRQRSYLDLLNKVPIFNEIPDYNLCKIIDILREVKYQPNQHIYSQGNKGETLYIIKQGTVEFRRKQAGQGTAIFMRVLTQGSFFGEKSLLGEEYYSNDANAGPKGCLLLQIEREAFSMFIGSISGLRNEYKPDYVKLQTTDTTVANPNDYQLSHVSGSIISDTSSNQSTFKYDTLKRLTLDEFHTVTTLGVGTFSRTELVVPKTDPRISYALKQMKKKNIVSLNLQLQIMNEKRLMLEINSNFIVKLFKTFRDRKYVYFLMEACLGGNLQRLIRENQCLTENSSRFYIGCVVEALKYLHKANVVYRDLKPSNVLMDDKGYCKLTNFTYSKKIQFGRRTFSFCGTPEYVAPEVILSKGHDFAVDYWGLGVCIYEMLVGKAPFSGEDPIKTYNIIMRGFDGIGFPVSVSRNAQMLVRKLCRLNPNERIGYNKNNMGEVQKHKWFDGFNWINLRNMVMDSPMVPQIKDTTEGYEDEDEFPRDEEIPPDETTGWDKDF